MTAMALHGKPLSFQKYKIENLNRRGKAMPESSQTVDGVGVVKSKTRRASASQSQTGDAENGRTRGDLFARLMSFVYNPETMCTDRRDFLRLSAGIAGATLL